MTVKVAINGFGRIGRAVLRANFELEPEKRKIQIVAINDLASPEANAHLTEFDSTHGRFGKAINVFEDVIQIEDEKIQMFSKKIQRIFHGEAWAWILCWNAQDSSLRRRRPRNILRQGHGRY